MVALLLSAVCATIQAVQAEKRPGAAHPSTSTAYQQAVPGYRYEFPRDHGSHDSFRTEWWYYTGHLSTVEGRRFGFELTFFRRAVVPPDSPPPASAWALTHLYLAHAALTDVDGKRFLYDEKVSRAGLGKAGADSGQLRVWIDRWRADASVEPDALHHLSATTPHFSLELELTPARPPVIHGRDGVSRKGTEPHETSHYYSITRLNTKGRIIFNGTSTDVTGLSWMDHEFGSGDLGQDLVGWDWFSLQLSNGMDLMLYRLRRGDGQPNSASSGTLIFPDGRLAPLAADDAQVSVLDSWTSPTSHARYPHGWELRIPTADLTLTVRPLLKEQELITTRSTQVTYWEGAVEIVGRSGSQPISGQGYVELTGYAKPFQAGP